MLAQQNRGGVTKPILEVNMRHPLVAAIAGNNDTAADLSLLLLEQAQILDGELPEDPAGFASRLNALVLRGIAKRDGIGQGS
jgi:molecular chaperone HtpG